MDTLTAAEAAARLGITARAVSLLLRRGALRGEKRGRDWFIAEDEVERYEAERRPPGRPRRLHDAE